MSIYQWYDVRTEYIEIKFQDSLSTSTLINANFALNDATSGTPITVADAFKPIVVNRDYYSISRILKLWFKVTLASATTYQVAITGLKTSIGNTIPPDSFTFVTETLVVDDSIVIPPDRIPVDVEDYSIKHAPSFSGTVIATIDPTVFNMNIVSPSTDVNYYLAPEAAEGRIGIQFTQSPAANYITSDYFKVQRKLVSRQLSRWEPVSALVTADNVNHVVYIYLPSDDTTPVYGEPDKVYWVPGYKYKVKILSGIGV